MACLRSLPRCWGARPADASAGAHRGADGVVAAPPQPPGTPGASLVPAPSPGIGLIAAAAEPGDAGSGRRRKSRKAAP